ncbi:MAG: hypothetical protein CSA81_03190 [Acidobacteria bacterium]|nr:MAG: hypothetical protein CSA81_03190 [Acidobacteriota bacterium]
MKDFQNYPYSEGYFKSTLPFYTTSNGVFFFVRYKTYPGFFSKYVKMGFIDSSEQVQLLSDVYKYEGHYKFKKHELNGLLLFTFYSDETGTELGISDGTPGGTGLLLDISPGSNSSLPRDFFVHDNCLFFTAVDENHGRELWKTDGTAEGTVLVIDIWPGSESSGIRRFYSWNGDLYLTANDGEHGREYWKTDGTAAGTQMLKDIWPGEKSSNPYRFVDLGDSFLFVAEDSEHGRELWISDGTEAGTNLFLDISPGPYCSSAGNFTIHNDNVFFTAGASHTGKELWVTDGTVPGTYLVEDLNPGPDSSAPQHLMTVGDTLYYFAYGGESGIELRALRLQPMGGFGSIVNLCENGQNRTAHALEPNPHAYFNWTVTGGEMTSGQGTRDMSFSVTDSSAVQIDLETITGNQSVFSSQTIPVLSTVPAAPEDINGEMLVCQGDTGMVYDVLPVETAIYYHWQVPADACIVEGQGSTSITVDFGRQSGVLSVAAENDCGQSLPTELSISFYSDNLPADAGPDQTVCGVETQLEANTVSAGSGTWTILSGDGGSIDDIHNPSSTFHGLAEQTYVLEWMVENGPCEATYSQVQITMMSDFLLAYAGEDQEACSSSIQLQANMPPMTQGRWECVEGEGGHFSQLSDPNAIFTGQPGQVYRLKWTLWSGPCPDSEDEVVISMLNLIVPYAGVDQCALLGEAVNLNAAGSPGFWSIVSGPDLSDAQFSDIHDPASLFTAAGGSGIYELKWQTLPTDCVPIADTVSIEVVESAFTRHALVEEPHTANTLDLGPYDISNMVLINGLAYFSAAGSYAGEELWRSDGTPGGTVFVKDFAQGYESNTSYNLTPYESRPEFLMELNGRHLFKADNRLVSASGDMSQFEVLVDQDFFPEMILQGHDCLILSFPENPRILWRSDGTAMGTEPYTEISGDPTFAMGLIGDSSFFWAHGGDIWKTDGTWSGTQLFSEFHGRGMEQSVVLNDLIFFVAKKGSQVKKLFCMNGSDGEVHFLKEVSDDPQMWVYEQMLFFTGQDEVGAELWRTDGTEAGTIRVRDIYLGTGNSDPKYLINFEGKMYFSAHNGEQRTLWASDGTRLGTVEVYEQEFLNAVLFQDQLILSSESPEGLWSSDGTSEGTYLFADVSVREMLSIGDFVLFCNGNQHLFRTDGTAAGTVLVGPGQDGELYHDFWYGTQSLGSKLVFVKNASSHEIWAHDGTPDGGQLLGTFDHPVTLSDEQNDAIYFSSGNDSYIWKTDGTTAGTEPFLDKSALEIDQTGNYFEHNGTLFFRDYITSNTYNNLWVTRGTEASTEIIAYIDWYSTSTEWVLFKGKTHFNAKNPSGHDVLFQSDGTSGGTSQVFANDEIRQPMNLRVTDDHSLLFFIASAPNQNYAFNLFCLNETSQNPIALLPSTYPGNAYSKFETSDTLLFFVLRSSQNNIQVYRSDGTVNGTFVVWSGESDVGHLVPNGDGSIYFTEKNELSGDKLMYSDGTLQGTYQCYDSVDQDGFNVVIQCLTSLNGTAYFTLSTSRMGTEIVGIKNGCSWLVDGEVPGTKSFYSRSLTSASTQMFYYKRGSSWLNSLEVLRPPLTMVKDPRLRNYIVGEFDNNRDSVIDEHEMLMIDKLDIPHAEISDLAGIEGFHALQEIRLNYNQIQNVEPLLLQSQQAKQPIQLIDISHNLLNEEDCPELLQLANRVTAMGGQVLYHNQGEIHYNPEWNTWPHYDISLLLKGVDIPEYTLPCQEARHD